MGYEHNIMTSIWLLYSGFSCHYSSLVLVVPSIFIIISAKHNSDWSCRSGPPATCAGGQIRIRIHFQGNVVIPTHQLLLGYDLLSTNSQSLLPSNYKISFSLFFFFLLTVVLLIQVKTTTLLYFLFSLLNKSKFMTRRPNMMQR